MDASAYDTYGGEMAQIPRLIDSPTLAERQYHDAIQQRKQQAGGPRDKAKRRYEEAEQLFALVRQEAEHVIGAPRTDEAAPGHNIVGQMLRRHSAAMQDLLKLENAYILAEERYRTVTCELSAYEDWLGRSWDLTDKLNAEYQGHGPQYDILIKRLVQAEIHAEQLEAQGQGNSPEHERTVKGVMLLVQALQKYTEDTGSLRKEI